MAKKTATKKNTPSNCKFPTCHFNPLPPPENSQECVACEGNTVKNWRPPDNPAIGITLHFQDGAALKFTMEKPVRQIEVMRFIGEFLAKTGNSIDMDIPETPLR